MIVCADWVYLKILLVYTQACVYIKTHVSLYKSLCSSIFSHILTYDLISWPEFKKPPKAFKMYRTLCGVKFFPRDKTRTLVWIQ